MTPETLLSPEIQKRIRITAGGFAVDRRDREDLIQELTIELLRNGHDDEGLQKAYLRCWSKAYKLWKRSETYADHINELFTSAEEEERDQNHEELLSDFLGGLHPSASIEDEIIKREEIELIEDILITLTPRHRKIFWMRYGGMNQEQIAQTYGLQKNAIWKQMQQIRKAIKAHPLAAQLFTHSIPV